MTGYHMLVIPESGFMSLYTPEAILAGGPWAIVRHPVRVDLSLDDKPLAVAYVSTDEARDRNPRAERAAYLLTGAYFKFHGPVVFDRLSEHGALELMTEVAA